MMMAYRALVASSLWNPCAVQRLCPCSTNRGFPMKSTSVITATLCMMVMLSACGNTIRGMGQDTANTVNATQNAGHRVGNAAAR